MRNLWMHSHHILMMSYTTVYWWNGAVWCLYCGIVPSHCAYGLALRPLTTSSLIDALLFTSILSRLWIAVFPSGELFVSVLRGVDGVLSLCTVFVFYLSNLTAVVVTARLTLKPDSSSVQIWPLTLRLVTAQWFALLVVVMVIMCYTLRNHRGWFFKILILVFKLLYSCDWWNLEYGDPKATRTAIQVFWSLTTLGPS